MSQTLDERLYNLLPALYHRRDLENGEALRALMAVLQTELKMLEADTAAGYNNWFIQTCDFWVIPYIADLIGIRDMSQDKYLFSTQRRQVANTIGYRRRKGTLPVLEHVLRDATSWLVRAVELSQTVASTQHVRYVRPGRGHTVDLRLSATLAQLEGPSNQLAHTADVHNISSESGTGVGSITSRPGKYGLSHVGLYFWRLRSYLMRNSPAHAVGTAEATRHFLYTFDPLGRDMPLFNYTQFIANINQRAEDIHMPLRLSREAFAADLKGYEEQYKDRQPEERPRNSAYYGPERGLNVTIPDGTPAGQSIPPTAVVSMDLSQWPTEGVFPAQERDKLVAIDVHLGRLALLTPHSHPGEVKVNYCYGLSAEIGGGPYRRLVPLTDSEQSGFQQNVAKGTTIHTLKQALDKWEEYCREFPSPSGVIRILDNGVYGGKINVRLPAGAQLAIIADNGARPTIRPIGNVNVIFAEVEQTNAQAEDTAHNGATPGKVTPEHTADQEKAVNTRGVLSARRFLLNGLLVFGGIHISAEGQLVETEKPVVTIGHCTLMPNGIKATWHETNAKGLEINIDHCIVGPLYLPAAIGSLTMTDSIIDHAGRGAGYAIAGDNRGAPGPTVNLERVTVFGQVSAAQVTARDVIFTGRVIAPPPKTQDRQVQFSYVPEDSTTPGGEPYRPISKKIMPPIFTSRRFGDPAYAQLSDQCSLDIRGGGSDGSEMGAFHDLHTLQAEANIPSVLDEYLPAGLQASVFYMT